MSYKKFVFQVMVDKDPVRGKQSIYMVRKFFFEIK